MLASVSRMRLFSAQYVSFLAGLALSVKDYALFSRLLQIGWFILQWWPSILRRGKGDFVRRLCALERAKIVCVFFVIFIAMYLHETVCFMIILRPSFIDNWCGSGRGIIQFCLIRTMSEHSVCVYRAQWSVYILFSGRTHPICMYCDISHSHRCTHRNMRTQKK